MRASLSREPPHGKLDPADLVSLTPILTYHKIAIRPKETIYPGTYVHPLTFARHVSYLTRRYGTATLAGYLENRDASGRIVLTFDDGTADFLSNAVPVLDEHLAHATVFLVSDETTNAWDVGIGDVEVPLLARSEIRQLGERVEIGSHTRTHADLSTLPEAYLESEVRQSREEVSQLSGRPCRSFCYPYGRKREAAIVAVRRAGYDGAVTTEKGTNEPGTDPFQLRRIAVRHDTSLPVLVYKLWRARRFGR